MARRGTGGEGGGIAGPLIGITVNLLIFVVLMIFAPTIAGTIEEGEAGLNMAVTSDWNRTHNPDLPSGVETWTTVVQIIAVVFLVIAISIAIFYLKGM